MKIIEEMIEELEEEVEGATEYAERYIESRARGDMSRANRFKEMASDELKHASYLHEWAVAEIQEISKVFVAPVEMQEKWDKAHKEYVERVAWIRQMLAM